MISIAQPVSIKIDPSKVTNLHKNSAGKYCVQGNGFEACLEELPNELKSLYELAQQARNDALSEALSIVHNEKVRAHCASQDTLPIDRIHHGISNAKSEPA